MSTQQPPLSLHRLTFVSALNQDLVADYLAHLQTRHSIGSCPPLGSHASGRM